MATQTSNTLSLIHPSNHSDFVHDIAFDHYGRRIATCSGDRTIRVWDLVDGVTDQQQPNNNGDTEGGSGPAQRWALKSNGCEFQAHRGSISRLSWAHPEFGQLLVTCGSSDHSATIWEERETTAQPAAFDQSDNNNLSNNNMSANMSNDKANTMRWVAKAQLTDARKAVTCAEFAPRHLGLRIATGSADGFVRIYEAIDVMNLNHWPMNTSIEVESSSNTSESTTHTQHGHSSSSLQKHTDLSSVLSSSQSLGVTALSWCNSRFEPATLVVGGHSGNVTVYRYSESSRAWSVSVKLPRHRSATLDVSWAPNVGRSFHLLASCGKDGRLTVHKLKRGNGNGSNNGKPPQRTLALESSNDLNTDGFRVWRVEWNITGTVLASSGDGGKVQLWKSDFCDRWKCVSDVQGDFSHLNQAREQ
mmetsp:Transcript_63393/g.74204  ORF Transcript_63393/g.74204 Transcript_63393/m.74204 type:complete len:417 (+) Transcript_63393:637-1887(+)